MYRLRYYRPIVSRTYYNHGLYIVKEERGVRGFRLAALNPLVRVVFWVHKTAEACFRQPYRELAGQSALPKRGEGRDFATQRKLRRTLQEEFATKTLFAAGYVGVELEARLLRILRYTPGLILFCR